MYVTVIINEQVLNLISNSLYFHQKYKRTWKHDSRENKWLLNVLLKILTQQSQVTLQSSRALAICRAQSCHYILQIIEFNFTSRAIRVWACSFFSSKLYLKKLYTKLTQLPHLHMRNQHFPPLKENYRAPINTVNWLLVKLKQIWTTDNENDRIFYLPLFRTVIRKYYIV